MENASQCSDSIAIGNEALRNSANAPYNIAIGTEALKNSAGVNNIAVGHQASFSNTTGVRNTAIGPGSLYTNESGTRNSGIGADTLFGLTNHSDNVAIGDEALVNITDGSRNIAIGSMAGKFFADFSNHISATGSIFIGYDTRASADNRQNEIVIGTNAIGLGSNTAVIGATGQVSATIYGLLNAPGGVSAAGGTFSGQLRVNGNLFANNIVNALNGLTGGVTLLAGSNVTLTPGVQGITISATSGGSSQPNYTTQTINFSELIDNLEFTIGGLGLSYSTSLQNANIDNIIGITLDTGVANSYSGVLKSIETFKDPPGGNTWAATIIMEPPFVGVSNTASGIINEVINKVYIDGTFYVSFGTPEYWTNITSQNVRHKEGTYAIKTITGQTWVTANSFITCEVMGITTTDHTPEDAIVEGVKFDIYNIVAGTGFDIIGHAPEGTYGKYTVKCLGQ
jgi:hypothetical protein